MTFHRGAALSTASTLGFADTADAGPTAGNGFYRRWPDDLAAIQEAGATDVRLTLDWARLQPRPDTFDDDWAERFEQMISAAGAIDLRVWATLHDGSIPRWFDNEGGLDDDDAVLRWWPRWVERAAERFGDTVDGWFPFANVPPALPEQAWSDTWSIVGGGRPVVAAFDPELTTGDRFVGRATATGLVLPTPWERDDELTEHRLVQVGTEWGQVVRDCADDVDTPIVIAGFGPRHDDPATTARIVEQLVAALDGAIADGVAVELGFFEPAIGAPDTTTGFLDAERAITPAGQSFLA